MPDVEINRHSPRVDTDESPRCYFEWPGPRARSVAPMDFHSWSCLVTPEAVLHDADGREEVPPCWLRSRGSPADIAPSLMADADVVRAGVAPGFRASRL